MWGSSCWAGVSEPVWYQILRHGRQLLLQMRLTLTDIWQHICIFKKTSSQRYIWISVLTLADIWPHICISKKQKHICISSPKKQDGKFVCLQSISGRVYLKTISDLFSLLPAFGVSTLLFQSHCSYLCFLGVCFGILVIYHNNLVKVDSRNCTFFCLFSFCLLSRTIWSRSIVSS